MAHTFALFGLFALFATGAAVCLDGDKLGDNKFCTTMDNYIGFCAETTCTPQMCGAKDFRNDPCGNDTYTGLCEGNGGMCKLTEFVNVPFTVRAESTQATAVAQQVNGVFEKHLDYVSSLGRFAKDSLPRCTPNENISHSNSKGKIACTATHCTLSCIENYAMLKDHNYKCDGVGAWTGSEKGQCEKKCAAPAVESGSVGSNNLTGQMDNGVYLFTMLVAHGVVTCKSLAQGGDVCTLSCLGDFRAKPPANGGVTNGVTNLTNLRCTADGDLSKDPAWKSTLLGSCEAATVIKGTVKLSLKDGETAADLKTNPTFLDRFKSVVATNIAGVDARHVRVEDID